MSAEDTIALMRQTAPDATPSSVETLRSTSSREMASRVRELGFTSEQSTEIGGAWDSFRGDDAWVNLLASLATMVETQRGHIDDPIPIWDDLDDAGPNGRMLYFYLFALCLPGTVEYLRAMNCPARTVDATLATLRRLDNTHERKWRTLGVDAGWWVLPTLRGELIQVGSLQFHRVNLGVGNLSPKPWYDDEEAATRGVGFRRGDPSLGIHIPQGTALDPASLDATFAEARDVIGSMWPADARRLATCQSWMLDDQLAQYLAPTSNVLGFQRRFTLLPRWESAADANASIVEFVFRAPGVAHADLPRRTTLERAVLDHLACGGQWRLRPGWLDFDGP